MHDQQTPASTCLFSIYASLRLYVCARPEDLRACVCVRAYVRARVHMVCVSRQAAGIYGPHGGSHIYIINLNYMALFVYQARSDEILIRCHAEEGHKFLINCSADLCTALT